MARRDSTERKGTLEGRKEDVDEEEKELPRAVRRATLYSARRKERERERESERARQMRRTSLRSDRSRARRRKRVGTGANRARWTRKEGGAGGE